MFEKLSTEHTDIAYVDLALAVWFLFTVFGIATRTRTLLTARWGENFRHLENGDWHARGAQHVALQRRHAEVAGADSGGSEYSRISP